LLGVLGQDGLMHLRRQISAAPTLRYLNSIAEITSAAPSTSNSK